MVELVLVIIHQTIPSIKLVLIVISFWKIIPTAKLRNLIIIFFTIIYVETVCIASQIFVHVNSFDY